MALYGVDISSYQTHVDYNLWSFYMIKASEGRTLKDKMLDIHYNGVHGEDRLFGFYHYAHPENNVMIDEAKFFLDLVGRHAGHAVYALDWEGKALRYGPDTALKWLNYVYMETGVRPLFYCSDSRTAQYAKIAKQNFGLWVAKYSSRGPAHIGWPICAMWQYSARDLDYDVFFGEPYTWKRYAAQGSLNAWTLPEASAGCTTRGSSPSRRSSTSSTKPGSRSTAFPGRRPSPGARCSPGEAGAGSPAWSSPGSGPPPTVSSGTKPKPPSGISRASKTWPSTASSAGRPGGPCSPTDGRKSKKKGIPVCFFLFLTGFPVLCVSKFIKPCLFIRKNTPAPTTGVFFLNRGQMTW